MLRKVSYLNETNLGIDSVCVNILYVTDFP